jgi:hypothetical protein
MGINWHKEECCNWYIGLSSLVDSMAISLVTCLYKRTYSWSYTSKSSRQRQHISPKRRYPPTIPHGVTAKKTTVLTITAMKTSKLIPRVHLCSIFHHFFIDQWPVTILCRVGACDIPITWNYLYSTVCIPSLAVDVSSLWYTTFWHCSVQGWRAINCMNGTLIKPRFYPEEKTNILIYEYKLYESSYNPFRLY